MATRLDNAVTRVLALKFKERDVLVTLLPAARAMGRAHDMIEFRLKGTQQKWQLSLEAVFLHVRQQDRDMLRDVVSKVKIN